MTDIPALDMIEDTLDLVAEWLIAAYGARIAAVSVQIEGHYGPLFDCYGIVPIMPERGRDADGHPKTRQTLEVCGRTEPLFQRLCPAIRFDHDNGRDVRHVTSSQLVRASDVSAHRRIDSCRLHGVLAIDARGR